MTGVLQDRKQMLLKRALLTEAVLIESPFKEDSAFTICNASLRKDCLQSYTGSSD